MWHMCLPHAKVLQDSDSGIVSDFYPDTLFLKAWHFATCLKHFD